MEPTAATHLIRIAEQQHGLFTTAQARAAGLSPDQITHRVRSGHWERLARGVYRVRGTAPTWQQRAKAATLIRPGSVASHLTAAALHGLDVPIEPKPTLIVASTGSARTPIATVHRLDLPIDQIVRRQLVPVTSGARTLVDCASVLGPNRLGRLVDDAMHRRVATVAKVRAIIGANRIARAAAALDALADRLEVWDHRIGPDSPAEARLIRQLREWGLPEPDRQIPIIDAQGLTIALVDVGWHRLRLGLEYDSVQWHGPAAWAGDEARHAQVEALGWCLLHVDKADLAPGATRLRDRLTAGFAHVRV